MPLRTMPSSMWWARSCPRLTSSACCATTTPVVSAMPILKIVSFATLTRASSARSARTHWRERRAWPCRDQKDRAVGGGGEVGGIRRGIPPLGPVLPSSELHESPMIQ
jgi:hypothetical protein